MTTYKMFFFCIVLDLHMPFPKAAKKLKPVIDHAITFHPLAFILKSVNTEINLLHFIFVLRTKRGCSPSP